MLFTPSVRLIKSRKLAVLIASLFFPSSFIFNTKLPDLHRSFWQLVQLHAKSQAKDSDTKMSNQRPSDEG